MYSFLLAVHSLMRWPVLISLVYAIYRAYNGWFLKKPFTHFDNSVKKWTVMLAHIQLGVGLILYCVSPLIHYFLQDFQDAVQQEPVRFFGLEHGIMMIVAIVIMTMGSAKAKRQQADIEKFKTVAVWFTVALLIIIVFIPWPCSPFASRPLF